VGVPQIRLVVLNFNGGELVERCVDHLEALDWPEDRLEIVVVDNDSHDGSADVFEGRSRVRLIRAGHNGGFPANNLGLRDLDGVDYVGLINNDAFVERGYLTPLVEALEASPAIGAACPKILLAHRFAPLTLRSPASQVVGDARALGVRISGVEVGGEDRWRHASWGPGFHGPEQGEGALASFRWTTGEARLGVPLLADESSARLCLSALRTMSVEIDAGSGPIDVEVGTEPVWVDVTVTAAPVDLINNVGSRLVKGGYSGDRGFLEPDVGQYEEARDVFAWCGAGVLFRTEYLADVGLFDERFFMYYEDTDLSWRGRLRGWRYRYVPDAVMRHVHAATSVEGSAMFNHFVLRNRLVMLTKSAPASVVAGAVARDAKELVAAGWRDVGRRVIRGRRPEPRAVLSRGRSFFAYVRLLPGLLADRRRIRAARSVPDDALMGWAE
jgi:GT2 family glycosyltransferase